MTAQVVDTVTGEIVETSSAEEARDLTDQIKVAVESTWHLIKRAYETRAWAALGYASWDDYCTREFGAQRLKLPREERQEVVASLRESGLSTRAIASATGYDKRTVGRDLDAGGADAPPEPEPADGQPDDAPAPAPEPVKGTDGKTYKPKTRSKPAITPEEQERNTAIAALVSSIEVLGRQDLTPDDFRQAINEFQSDRIARSLEQAVEWLLSLHDQWDA